VQSGTDTTVQTNPSGAGQTSDPNVTRDAWRREHMNKGKHTGQETNKPKY
jgi:hypothetical protein